MVIGDHVFSFNTVVVGGRLLRWWKRDKKTWCWLSMIKIRSLLYLMVTISFAMVGNNFPFPY